jgi:uncharacterized protein DUF3800
VQDIERNASGISQFKVLRFGERHLVLMLQSYFDESGHSKDPVSHVVSVGGALASYEKWQQFEPRWKQLLRRFDVAEFHAINFRHSNDDFAGWKGYEALRRAFMQSALEIANDCVDFYVGFAVSIEAFERLPESARRKLVDLYYPCIQVCFENVAKHAYGLPPEEQVALFVAEQREFTKRLGEFVSRCREEFSGGDKDGRFRGLGQRLGAQTTIPSDDIGPATRKVVQLQIGDLVAYEVAHHCEQNLSRPESDRHYDWPLQQLMKKPHVFGLFQDEGLQDGFSRKNDEATKIDGICQV